jgi:signal transduction histidine kinase
LSDQKRDAIESIRNAQAEMERALAHIEQLPAFDPGAVSFAAHALTNYLTVTGATIEFLQEALTDYPDAQVKTWIEGLLRATDMMRHTASQLMSTSTNGDPQLIFRQVDLVRLVDRACEYYRHIACNKDIRIIYESGGTGRYVWTDPVALAAILDNLLSNAVKFSEPGARVWAEVRSESSHMVCSVRDEGPGLSETDQERLFERGSQLTPKPTGGEPSTGYGLAVARALADKLGADIWCDSKLGRGSVFSVRLPVHVEKHVTPQAEAS